MKKQNILQSYDALVEKTMKKINIAIIGAGQCGLQLAIHLLKTNRFNVNLFSKNTAKEILDGRILSSQVMFHDALEKERALGLNFWDTDCPPTDTFSCTVLVPDGLNTKIFWESKTRPFQSIDQRVKFSRWSTEFQKLGGNLFIKEVNFEDLTDLATQNELVIVATGKGSLSQKFEIDQERTKFKTPQRRIVCLYVQGLYPRGTGVRANIIPKTGEFFTTPGLTKEGPCEMMLFEGVPFGPFDCWENIKTPDAMLKQALKLLEQYVPWEHERCQHIKLCDQHAILSGKIHPLIRKPIIESAGGHAIFGIADTVVLNDPIAGQGANHAAKVAYEVANHIIQNENLVFDRNWMEQVAKETWHKYSRPSTLLSNLLLSPTPHLVNTFSMAANNIHLAAQLAEGFNDPSSLSSLLDLS
jgi:hypothetical protein